MTLSPTLGIAPLPSWRMVFETPMIADVRVKVRVLVIVDCESLVAAIRSCEVENM